MRVSENLARHALSRRVGDHLARELITRVEQAVLDDAVGDRGVHLAWPSMVDVATALPREWVATGREPNLCLGPRAKLAGASRPPIFVRTQPGSTELLTTSGHRRATATASTASKSLESQYA
jgi:hypothetical protein